MKVEGSPRANRNVRAVLAGLMAGFLASCTTSGPGLDMAAPSYSGVGVAAVMAEVAQSESDAAAVSGGEDAAAATLSATADGDDQAPLPEQIALVPTSAGPADTAAAPDGAPAAEAGGEASTQAAVETGPKKRGFFASFFSPAPAGAPPAQASLASAEKPAAPVDQEATEEQAPVTDTDEASEPSVEIAEKSAEPAPAAAAQTAATRDEAAEPAAEAGETSTQVAVTTEPRKRSFLASLFSPAPADAQPSAQSAFAPGKAAAAPLIRQAAQEKAAPLVDLSKKERRVQQASFSGDALPGVRRTSLFEITHKSGIDDDSTIDLYEDVDSPVVLASAAGLARLAPNGLLKQRESVDVGCLKPALVRMLKTVERHYGKRMVVTSGYRSPSYNKRVRGARRSQHMYCAAADVQVPGVSKWELARFVRSMPGRGGVGTYCHTESVHIDIGPERDWNWRCRRRKS